MKLKLPNPKKLEEHHNRRRAEMSDYLLLHYFKVIRFQCKYLGRSDETLLKYINELEYRNMRYRL